MRNNGRGETTIFEGAQIDIKHVTDGKHRPKNHIMCDLTAFSNATTLKRD